MSYGPGSGDFPRIYQLAEVNVSILKPDADPAEYARFELEIDPVLAVARVADGFRWALPPEQAATTMPTIYGDRPVLANMSTWDSEADLMRFARGPEHVAIMQQYGYLFERIVERHVAVWWMRGARIPTLGEGALRLEYLRDHGPTPVAFGLRDLNRFGMPSHASELLPTA